MPFASSLEARLASQRSWARTPSRLARTQTARSNSPAGIDWHVARLGPEFDDASQADRLAAAEMARKAYMTSLQIKAAEARRTKRGAA